MVVVTCAWPSIACTSDSGKARTETVPKQRRRSWKRTRCRPARSSAAGVIFLFVAFLQATLGYTALEAGAATLPVTLLLLVLSAPSGALAQRIGPRIPLAIGSLPSGVGLLGLSRIQAGDEYFTGVAIAGCLWAGPRRRHHPDHRDGARNRRLSPTPGLPPGSTTRSPASANSSRWRSSRLPRGSPGRTSRTPQRWRRAFLSR